MTESQPAVSSDLSVSALLAPSDTFVHRHIGPREADIAAMLASLEEAGLDAVVARWPAPALVKGP